ncbi:hypothetical protein K7432_015985 [Basidiobolus ranarum]|uniref:Uncharacterized protein n=1 Tax=Basidiobolus ranarum TaxID=34480 RepID=A0ABR2VM98_9FUNG
MYSRLIGTSILLATSILTASAGTAQVVELDSGHVYKIQGNHGDCVNIRSMILVYTARISEDPIGFTVHSGPNCTPDTRVHCIDRRSPTNLFMNPQIGQSIGFFDDSSRTCAPSSNHPFGGSARDDYILNHRYHSDSFYGNKYLFEDTDDSYNNPNDEEIVQVNDTKDEEIVQDNDADDDRNTPFGSSGIIIDENKERRHSKHQHRPGGFGSTGYIKNLYR